MYFYILAVFISISYFLITYFFQLFFNGKIEKTKFSIFHILGLLGFLYITIFVVQKIPDSEFANRIQHIFAGGFLMIILSFFSYKSSLTKVSKFQFFCFSIMIATCFGVLNELLESILQIKKNMMFSTTFIDTWFDLWANTIGALFGALVFTALVKK